jgi:hypothetical protein
MSNNVAQTPENKSPAPPPVSLEPPKTKRRYFVKFDGNGSKRWDGKEI